MNVSRSSLKPPQTIIKSEEHASRRQKVMREFGPRDLIFFPGNKEVQRNPDVPYPFRQESNFRYLFGINLPGMSAILVPGEGKFILFAPKQGVDDRVWGGNMPSHDELKKWYGAHEVHEPSALPEVAKRFNNQVIHTLHIESSFSVPEARKEVDGKLADVLINMRLVKSPDEISAIHEAIRITAIGFDAAIKATAAGKREGEVQAVLEYNYRYNGASFAFSPIVTMDGNVLHNPEYRRQFMNDVLVNGRMLLIDSGAEVEGYSGDITRTIPVSGKFTKKQGEIYDVVLRAKKTATDALKPGVSFKDVHLISERVIAEGLKAIGILKGNTDEILASGAHRLFIAHGLGHAMGLDDHDIGEYKDKVAGYSSTFPRESDFGIKSLRFARVLAPGNVVTVEPGIYFIDAVLNSEQNRAKFREFVNFDKAVTYMVSVSGIRIEDDVLITSGGHRVLWPYIPQERHEIEALMRR